MRKISLSVIGTLLGLCAVLSVSYAFYVVLPTNKASASTNVAITECGSITLRDVQALTLSGDKSAPVKDFKVLNSPEGYEYTFIVTNPCSESSNLHVSLVPKTNSDMPVKAIKYALKEENGTYPSEGAFLSKKKLDYNETTQSELVSQLGSTYTTGYEVLQTTLSGNETKTYKLLLWIDYEEGGLGDNATMNKIFDSYLVLSDNLGEVSAGQITITLENNETSLPNYALSKYTIDTSDCNGVEWNDKYQAIDLTGSYDDCTLTAYDRLTTQTRMRLASPTYEPISTTISNMVDTTQGDGKVVREVLSRLPKSQYLNQNDLNGYLFVWDSADATWTSKNITNGLTYTISFNLSPGYYQLCYTMSSEQYSDYGIIKIDNVEKFNTAGKNTTTYICESLGNITASNAITVSYKKNFGGNSSSDSSSDYFVFYIGKEVRAGIRYEGANPDNFVWFNNELWRIIGVFDVETEDGTAQSLTKIIRNDPINNLALDGKSSGHTNFWSQSTLYKLLNPVDGDANSGAYYNGVDNNTYCYGYQHNKKGDCNFSANGITSESYRSMIAKVVWEFGGTNYDSTAPTAYEEERVKVVSSDNASYGTPEVLNYIGLMYASDFGYSVLDCHRATSMGSYNSCIANAWLYTPYAWTMSPMGNSSLRMINVNTLNLRDAETNNGYAVRPSLYLKSNVYITGGSGSASDPYIIKEA